MKTSVLQWLYVISIFSLPTSIFAQSKYDLVRKELTTWDATRGSWIADSYEALEKGYTVPDRMFEEDLTPAELFQLAPEQTRKNIQNIISQHPQTNETVAKIPFAAPSVGPDGIQRLALEESSTSPSNQKNNTRTVNSTGNYNAIFRNSDCNLIQGRSYGDPHIRTFDGSTFSFQTVGEYVLARSKDGQFEVQTRQKAETDKVSLNSAVALNVAGDQIGIYAQDIPNRQNAPLRVNGESVFINNDTYFLPSGGTIQQTAKKYIVTWPTGERVQADMITSSGRAFINLSIFVYNCYGDYYGILGNGNGNRGDDFQANGRNISNGIVFDPFENRQFDTHSIRAEREQLNFLARDFGSQFLVTDRTSLFEYDLGYYSWSFNDPLFPRVHLTMNDITPSQRERARQECIRQGIANDELSACIMDFSHANIAPAPRVTTPDRITGRSIAPIYNQRPNVNRSDAGGGRGIRTPWESGRTQQNEKPSNRSSSDTQLEDIREINIMTNPIERNSTRANIPTTESSPLPNSKQEEVSNGRNESFTKPNAHSAIERRSLDIPTNDSPIINTTPVMRTQTINTPDNMIRQPLDKNPLRETNERNSINATSESTSKPNVNTGSTRIKGNITHNQNNTNYTKSNVSSQTQSYGNTTAAPQNRGTTLGTPNTRSRR